jgi:hypothetical protein
MQVVTTVGLDIAKSVFQVHGTKQTSVCVASMSTFGGKTDIHRTRRSCPLLAHSRHEPLHRTCPLLGVKRTSR